MALTKKEIKTASNSELLIDYVRSFASCETSYNLGRGIKQLQAHITDLESAIVARGILSEDDIRRINM